MSLTHGDGWTVVRRGGRRRPPGQGVYEDRPRTGFDGRQNHFSYRGGRDYRGKDRAPPVSHRDGGQVQFPFPNQPAPPLGRPRPLYPGRYLGPQSQSYASVVRQANPKTIRGPSNSGYQGPGTRPRQQHPDRVFSVNRSQPVVPTDPKFGQLVRKMHKVIKMVHHLQNVTPEPDKSEPFMISRMVNILSSMIKPAAPTADTLDLIVGNAKNWGYTTLVILEDHYKAGLGTLLEDLSRELVPQWNTAFVVATKWARKNLPRIKQEVIDHAEALISACEHSETVPDQREKLPPQNKSTEQQPPPPPLQDTNTEQQPPPQDTNTEQQPPPQGINTQRPKSPQHTPPATISLPTEIPQLRTTAVGDQREELTHQSPKAQRFPRKSTKPTREVAQTNLIGLEIGGVEFSQSDNRDSPRATKPGANHSLLDEDLWSNLDTTPILGLEMGSASPRGAEAGSPRAHQRAVPFQGPPEDPNGTSEGDSRMENTSTPQPYFYKVKRHITTDRKMVDWGLNVSKKWLIIGDSNLSRIPMYAIPDLQMESYPGANFRHAQSILSKASGLVTVEKVVLSFGLNCRGQKAKETSVKQLQAAVREAKRQFPFAEIWIPLINFSSSLPREEQLSLQTLNHHISKNMPFLPLLPTSDFQTERDGVHWTRDTARAMFHHWLDCLNLRSP